MFEETSNISAVRRGLYPSGSQSLMGESPAQDRAVSPGWARQTEDNFLDLLTLTDSQTFCLLPRPKGWS